MVFNHLNKHPSIFWCIQRPTGGDKVPILHDVWRYARVKAKKTFHEALKDVKAQAMMLVEEIEDLYVEEAEIKFGINTVGEVGNIAIGKVGVGVNYEVTLKWKKPNNQKSR